MADYSQGPYDCIGCGPFNKCSCDRKRREFTDCEPIGRAADMAVPPAVDMVNHPPHYIKPWGEVIDITEHMSFCLGNVVKYVLRWEDKGGLEDLRKALFYLEREVDRLEGKPWTGRREPLHAEPFG